MNYLARLMADAIQPRNFYAWIITKDHLDYDEQDDTGTTGPSLAPDELLAQLNKGKGHTFKMYDDDGELYYTGRLLFDEKHPDFDEGTAIIGPLEDFGTPNAGAVRIKYAGHPEWDIS